MEINCSAHSTSLFQKKIEDLESVILMKDLRIKYLQSDNEKLIIKVKKLQICNRKFQQQLNDEKRLYEYKKEHFQKELDNQRKRSNISISRRHLCQQRELARTFEAIQKENKHLKDELSEQHEITYDLNVKYQKLKDARNLLREKHKLLFQNYLRALTEMMENLDEARKEFNSIVSMQLHHLPFEKAEYLQIVQKNRELKYDNASYKFQVLELKDRLNQVEYEMQKFKIYNASTQTSESSITSRSEQSQFQALKTLCFSERMGIRNGQSSGNTNESKQSATEIEESSVIQQDQFCETCHKCISDDITTSEDDIRISDGDTNTDESSKS